MNPNNPNNPNPNDPNQQNLFGECYRPMMDALANQPLYSPGFMQGFPNWGQCGSPAGPHGFSQFRPQSGGPNFGFNQYSQTPSSPGFVPETQFGNEQAAPSSPKQSKSKKQSRVRGSKNKEVLVDVDNDQLRSKRITWVEDEEIALAESWIDVSEDKALGNNQTATAFWERVHAGFLSRMQRPSIRTADALSSKWKDLKLKVGKFVGLYNSHSNNRRSGWSDDDVFDAANADYRRDNKGVSFPHKAAWTIMKKTTRWQKTQTFHQSKRSKTTSETDPTQESGSDGRCFVDLNDVDLAAESDEDVPRPSGRDKAKEAKRKGKKHAESSGNRYEEMLDNLSLDMKQFLANQEKNFKQKEKSYKQKERGQEIKDLKLIMMTAETLPERKRNILLKTQEKLMKKYEKKLQQDDDEDED